MIIKTFKTILENDIVVTLISSVVIGFLGYVVSLLKRMKSTQESRISEEEEKLKSIKRGILRAEYLQIYNSTSFTQEEKYGLTRDIIKSYKNLNGNHYIHELDNKLKESLLSEIK